MPIRKYIPIIFMLFLVSCSQQQSIPSQPPETNRAVLATDVAQTLTALVPHEPAASKTEVPAAALPGGTSLPAALNQTSTPSPIPATTVPSKTTGATGGVTSTPPAAQAAAAGVQPTQTPASTAASGLAATSLPAQATPAAPAADCIDKAAFITDLTIPDRTLLAVNTDFVKTWKFRNVGTCTWGDGYQLVFAQGHIMGGAPSSPIPRAAPGDNIDVSVSLRSPAQGGTYAGDWQFQNAAGKRFGVNSHGEDFFFVIIRVDWGPGIGPTLTPPPANCALTQNTAYETQLLQLINSARATNLLPALALQNQLSAAAQAHSADMACNNYLDHIGSDKSNYSDRIKLQGYPGTYDSENIYAGGSAQDAFDWWMNSTVHRDNILSSKITQIGISYAFYAGSKFGGYYTLDFGHP